MTVRTDVNLKHLLRLGILAAFCLFGGAWFCYDGMVGWPNQQKWAQAYLKFAEEHSELGAKDLLEQWKEHAAEQGWPDWLKHNDPPDGEDWTPYGAPRSDGDITGQFFYSGVAGLLGLFFLGRFFLWKSAWIEADENGLRGSDGKQVDYKNIQALDKKKWPKKGIAYVRYDEGGNRRKIVIDDCNYDRDTTQTILRKVEEEIGAEKIVNGKPEPPPKVEEGDATHSLATDQTHKSTP